MTGSNLVGWITCRPAGHARRSRQERRRRSRNPEHRQSPAKGSATLTDAQAADLTSGKIYVNIHTAANPGGKLRGQVKK